MAQTDVHLYPGHLVHSPEYESPTYAILQDDLDQPFHFAEQPPIASAPSTPADDPAPFAQYTSLVGRTITSPSAGRFRLAFRHVLGVGAYGVVYLAEEVEREEGRYAWFSPSATPDRRERQTTISSTRRMYAVKVMRCAPRGSRQRAFQAREVALHRKADGHPGIVPLHAVYGTGQPTAWSPRKRKSWSSHSRLARLEDELTWDRDAELSGGPLPLLENGQPEELVYMVLSYVGGGDLFTMIAEKQRYIGDDALIKSVFLQLLDAVEWCHRRGVRHRDLKPENILCENDGSTVYISDFGLATMDRESRDFGCGSSYYMSPECYGNPVAPEKSPNYDTCANDIWTLGIVLMNLATGRNPWEAASPLDATFASYCADPTRFLMSILPITPCANAVFVRIFDQDQARRCTLPELREMVRRVDRWTLRGAELDGADEGARDVALGCGLLDMPAQGVQADVDMGQRVGSSGMAERSRFSEDTVLDRDQDDDECDYEADEDWSVYDSGGRGVGMGRARSESSVSTSSEMSRSRPVSKILSNSPTLQGPFWGGPIPEQGLSESESIPRWPPMVPGWDGVEPSTPPRRAALESVTPKAVISATPRPTGIPRIPELHTPRSSPSMRTPRSNPALEAGNVPAEATRPRSPGLLTASRIPRYTGSPRTRTVSFDPPPRTRTISFEPESLAHTSTFQPGPRVRTMSHDPGRERMQSAPSPEVVKKPNSLRPKVSFGDFSAMALGRLRKVSMRELHSKGSLSTLSVASSESSGFPVTPLKAEVVLSSPRVIVSHPSDGKMWDVPRSSESSLWDTSSERTGETSAEPPHRPFGLMAGAPRYDSSRLVDRNPMYLSKAWGHSSSSLSQSPAEEPIQVDRRKSPRIESPPKRRVKRVPVPPIPNELLEEHERQRTIRGKGPSAKMYELGVDASSSDRIPSPPGLVMEECRSTPGPKRLLENARAWFRRI